MPIQHLQHEGPHQASSVDTGRVAAMSVLVPGCGPLCLMEQLTFNDGGQRLISKLGCPESQLEDLKVASSIIEEDLTIEGNLNSSEGGIEVKGRVVGDVSAETITVQVGGSVDGALSAKKIVIEGKHKGSLKCDDLKIASTAQIQADVTAKTMATESGAKVVGKVNIAGGQ